MKQVAALVAAVVMVVGALWARDALDDRAGGGDGGDDGPVAVGDPPELLCATELAEVCEGLDVEPEIEDAGVTLDRLAAGEPLGADGWLVTAPWPEMAVVAGEEAGVGPFEVGDVLARSPAVIVMWPDREQALAGHCGAPVDWDCLGQAVGEPWAEHGGEPGWGTVRVAHPGPGTAAGLTVLAGAVASRLGTTGYAANDFDDAEFDAWFTGLEGAADLDHPPDGAVREMLTIGRGGAAAVGALEAEAGPQVARATARDATVLYPSPMVTADVVLATVPGEGRAGDVRDVVGADEAGDLLAAAGWRVDGRPLADGLAAVDLPEGSNLPSPGVLVALRELAVEAAR